MADEAKPRPKFVRCRVPINDGFTESATYTGTAQRYHGVSISYRPALQEEVNGYQDDPRDFVVKAREMVLRHVRGWNVANDAGDDVAPLNADTVKQLAYQVLCWMCDCITGYGPAAEVTDAKN